MDHSRTTARTADPKARHLSSPNWTRTNNLPINSRLLCQLSYGGSSFRFGPRFPGLLGARCGTYISALGGVVRQSLSPAAPADPLPGVPRARPARHPGMLGSADGSPPR